MRLPHVARYLVRDGKEIVVDPAPDGDEETIRLFLLGTAMGALMLQRGLLPVHASGIITRHGVVAFAGPSGSGKSVLAAVFRGRGYRVLTDDLLAIRLGAEPSVMPGPPQLQLWADALGRLGIEAGELRAVRPKLQKYVLPLEDSVPAEPVRLHKIISLTRADTLELVSVTGRERVMRLAGHTYRRLFSTNGRLSEAYSESVRSVARCTPIIRAVWPDAAHPDTEWRLQELADLVAQEIDS